MWSRISLIFSCCILLLFLQAAVANEAGFCLQGAQNLPPTDSRLSKGSRAMPPAQPVLAAHDWDLSHPANQQQATGAYTPCHADAPIFRYKVFKGVVYADHNHHKDGRYMSYRQAFLEQLVLAVWLYSDFPDVDLIVDYTDHPQLCDQDIPFLRYSILNASLLPAHQQHNLTELLSTAWVSQQYAAQVKTHTKGFTIPSPEAWRDLSLTPAQLQDFTKCMDATHPWDSKQLKAFWRGQATGCSRGWPQQHSHTTAAGGGGGAGQEQQQSQQQQQPVPHLLRNKRVQMVLRLFPYGPACADVGITSLPQLTPECLGPPGSHAGLQAQQQQQHPQEVGDTAAAGGPMLAGRRRRQRMRRQRRQGPGRYLTTSSSISAGSTPVQQPAAAAAAAAGQGVSSPTTSGPQPSSHDAPRATVAGLLLGLLGGQRRLAARPRRTAVGQQPQQTAPDGSGGSSSSSSVDTAAAASAGVGDGGGQQDWLTGVKVPPIRAYRGVASLLHKEGIGLEGWADAVLTLSIDGYGPPFRLPLQLLLGSAVLRMASPYQTWLDWGLLAGFHLQEFAYDLTDLEGQLVQELGVSGSSSGSSEAPRGGGGSRESLRAMAAAARDLVASRVHVVAQLDAFAWSIARYKEVCKWEVAAPGDAWSVLTLGADLFGAKGVPQDVHLQVMRHLEKNFAAALQHPALQGPGGAG